MNLNISRVALVLGGIALLVLGIWDLFTNSNGNVLRVVVDFAAIIVGAVLLTQGKISV